MSQRMNYHSQEPSPQRLLEELRDERAQVLNILKENQDKAILALLPHWVGLGYSDWLYEEPKTQADEVAKEFLKKGDLSEEAMLKVLEVLPMTAKSSRNGVPVSYRVLHLGASKSWEGLACRTKNFNFVPRFFVAYFRRQHPTAKVQSIWITSCDKTQAPRGFQLHVDKTLLPSYTAIFGAPPGATDGGLWVHKKCLEDKNGNINLDGVLKREDGSPWEESRSMDELRFRRDQRLYSGDQPGYRLAFNFQQFDARYPHCSVPPSWDGPRWAVTFFTEETKATWIDLRQIGLDWLPPHEVEQYCRERNRILSAGTCEDEREEEAEEEEEGEEPEASGKGGEEPTLDVENDEEGDDGEGSEEEDEEEDDAEESDTQPPAKRHKVDCQEPAEPASSSSAASSSTGEGVRPRGRPRTAEDSAAIEARNAYQRQWAADEPEGKRLKAKYDILRNQDKEDAEKEGATVEQKLKALIHGMLDRRDTGLRQHEDRERKFQQAKTLANQLPEGHPACALLLGIDLPTKKGGIYHKNKKETWQCFALRALMELGFSMTWLGLSKAFQLTEDNTRAQKAQDLIRKCLKLPKGGRSTRNPGVYEYLKMQDERDAAAPAATVEMKLKATLHDILGRLHKFSHDAREKLFQDASKLAEQLPENHSARAARALLGCVAVREPDGIYSRRYRESWQCHVCRALTELGCRMQLKGLYTHFKLPRENDDLSREWVRKAEKKIMECLRSIK